MSVGHYGFAFAMVVLTGWLFWQTSRNQLVLTRAENTEDRAEELHEFGLMPGFVVLALGPAS